MDTVPQLMCPEHQKLILFLDLKPGQQKGQRTQCASCRLIEPTELEIGFKKWKEYQTNELKQKQIDGLQLLSPLTNLEKEFLSLKDNIIKTMDYFIQVIQDLKRPISAQIEADLQKIKIYDTNITLSKLQEIAEIISEKYQITENLLDIFRWTNTYQTTLKNVNKLIFESNSKMLVAAEKIRKNILEKLEDFYNFQCDKGKKAKYLGVELQNQGQQNEALSFFNQLIQVNPNNYQCYFWKAQILCDQCQYLKALEYFDLCIQINPFYSIAWNDKGFTLIHLKRFEEGIICSNEAIKLNQNIFNSYNNKGWALNQLGRYQEALVCFDQALSIEPSYHKSLNHKGFSLLKLNLPHDALEFINQSIIQQPNYWQAHFNKGLVLEYMKKYSEALVCYDTAISLAPDEPKIYFNKGNALRSSGKKNQAADSYKIALIKGYADPQEIQTILKQIKN